MLKIILASFLFLASCTTQQILFEEMNKVSGYSHFNKIGWIHFREYKCQFNEEKQEYLAIDVSGNPVIIVTCCSFWQCSAYVVKI